MTDFTDQPPGATPLDPDDLEGLIPSWVTTRDDLNQVESANILRAQAWAFSGRGRTPKWLLAPDRLHAIHRRMFSDVWKWAGKTRRRDTNIGVDWTHIPVAVHDLCEDTKAQIGDGHLMAYPASELAARFHHRLVAVHPYPNGNGRHARLAADLLVRALGEAPFSWGRGDLTTANAVRARYLEALRAADRSDYTALINFVRS